MAFKDFVLIISCLDCYNHCAGLPPHSFLHTKTLFDTASLGLEHDILNYNCFFLCLYIIKGIESQRKI